MPLDPRTDAEVMVDFTTAKLADGQYYRLSGLNIGTTTTDFTIYTNGKTVHITLGIKCNKEAYLYFYEGLTVTADGTEVKPVQMKRTSSNSSTAQAFVSPSVVTTGAELFNDYIPGTTGPIVSAGGNVNSGVEWILSPSKKYLLRVTALETGTTWGGGEYYEHE